MKTMPNFTFLLDTYSGLNLVPSESWELTQNATIYLSGTITPELANNFRQQLNFLAQMEDLVGSVKVVINSPGGSVTAGMAIIDVLQSSKLDIDLVCFGEAYSMAAVILASGRKGHRFIHPHSMVMIHEVQLASSEGQRPLSGIEATAQLGDKFRKLTNSALAKATGHTLDEIDKATRHDNFMTAKEALEFGIVDEIIGERG